MFPGKPCYMNTFAYMFKTIKKYIGWKVLTHSVVLQQLYIEHLLHANHWVGTGDTNVAWTYKMPAFFSLFSEEEKNATTGSNVAGYLFSIKVFIPSSFWLTPSSFSGNCFWLNASVWPKVMSPHLETTHIQWLIYTELRKPEPPYPTLG